MYISLCVIAKNEEENIEKCLNHLNSVVDEKILVDTGSTDKTVELAKKAGAKVFDFEWIDDFSAAKNFAIEKAKGDWIIFLDCDEYFTEESIGRIKSIIKQANKIPKAEGIKPEMINIRKDGSVISVLNNISPRIFKNMKKIRYKGKIHEQLLNINTNYGISSLDFTELLKLMHTGYDSEIVKEKEKSKRNVEMLKKELESKPDSKLLNFQIGESLLLDKENSDKHEAIGYFIKAIECIDDGKVVGLNEKSYRNIMVSMIGQPLSEVKKIFEIAVQCNKKYPDFYFQIAHRYWVDKDFENAIKYCEESIKYCNEYDNKIESHAVGDIASIYNLLLVACIEANNKPKIVKTAVILLKSDKYNYENLTILMRTLLTQEKEENIIDFLSRIYDYNNFKDKIYLIKSSEKCENMKMCKYYEDLLTDEEKEIVENSLEDEVKENEMDDNGLAKKARIQIQEFIKLND